MSWEPIVTWAGLISGAVFALLGYLRSRKSDAVAAGSGVVVEERMRLAQVQTALEGLVNTYQEDTSGFREHIKYLDARLETCHAERAALTLEIARMRRKFGENGT